MLRVDADFLYQRRLTIVALSREGGDPASPQTTLLAHAPRNTTKPRLREARLASRRCTAVAPCRSASTSIVAVGGLLRSRAARDTGRVGRGIELQVLRAGAGATTTAVVGGLATVEVGHGWMWGAMRNEGRAVRREKNKEEITREKMVEEVEVGGGAVATTRRAGQGVVTDGYTENDSLELR